MQLLHADVSGPFPIPGFAAERYFLTIVDDYSRWVQIIPMNTKSETNAYFQNFILTAENHFSPRGLKVSQVCTDNGTEFDNKAMKQLYFDKGITHQLTVPYNSSQNGVAERKHRTVKEKARVLLHSSGLPAQFWSEAVKTAEFVINRYPSQSLAGDSPFSRWYGYPSIYSVFHPFGVQCHVLIPPAKRPSAFSPVSSDAIFVGYSPVHKAYRCYVPDLKDVIISNNVKFTDTVFPCLQSPSLLDNDGIDSLPSDVLFGAPALGAYFPSSISPPSDRHYGPSSNDSDDESLAQPDPPRAAADTQPSASIVEVSSSAVPDPSKPDSLSSVPVVGAPAPLCPPSSENRVVPFHPAVSMSPTLSDISTVDMFPATFEYNEPEREIELDAPNHDNALILAHDSTPLAPIQNTALIPLPAAVPVLEPLAPVLPPVLPPSTDSDSRMLALLPDDNNSTPSEPHLTRSISQVTDDNGPDPKRVDDAAVHCPSPPDINTSTALVRTISEVTNFDGPFPKRPDVAHPVSGHVFHALHSVHRAFVTMTSATYLPSTIQEALASPAFVSWIQAINKELDAHRENHTWTMATLPAGRRAIGCRWVFTIKDNTTPPTYKARLVAQGFRQVHGLDYGETFSPVVRYESIRVLFALAATFDLVIHQMDVTTAFLNGELHEDIYMQPPPGSPASGSKVCHPNKSLYGLKQAPLCWNVKINQLLLDFGFVRSMSEFGV